MVFGTANLYSKNFGGTKVSIVSRVYHPNGLDIAIIHLDQSASSDKVIKLNYEWNCEQSQQVQLFGWGSTAYEEMASILQKLVTKVSKCDSEEIQTQIKEKTTCNVSVCLFFPPSTASRLSCNDVTTIVKDICNIFKTKKNLFVFFVLFSYIGRQWWSVG